MRRERTEKKGFFAYIPVWTIVLFALAAVAGIIELISKHSVALADFINETTGRVLRAGFSYLTFIFPFSVAEMLLLFSPVLLIVLIVAVIKFSKKSWKALSRFIAGFLALVSLVYTAFVFTMGTAYYGTTVADKMGVPRRDVSAEELYDTANMLINIASEQTDKIMYPERTYSSMPYEYSEMNRKLNVAYKKLCEKYDGIDSLYSRTKPVILSPYWTYTHISGVYSFFTGEANVNTNYPDFIIASSAAHEMAHQRGVATEDEANFVAFVVCMMSDDPFLRYAGCLDMYGNFASSLAGASPELYAKLYSQIPDEIKRDLVAYSEFFEKYRDNVAADVSDKINDGYIKDHGQPEGIKSYGMVVDLVVSYMLYS